MQTAREYLIEHDLAGKRGRFSEAARLMLQKALLDGVEFSDWGPDGKIDKPVAEKRTRRKAPGTVAVKARKLIPVREENAIKWTDAEGMSGVMSTCKNNHPISVCSCQNPEPKEYLNAIEYELIYTEHA